MTDDERFLEDVERSASPVLPALALSEWDALPLPVRVADRLAEALIAASEIRAALNSAEASSLAWIVPEIDDVLERIDGALQRLAS
jgi:hypothetical protein